jgi:MFS family permease
MIQDIAVSTLDQSLRGPRPMTARPSTYHLILFAICFFSTLVGGMVSTLMSVYLPVTVQELLGSRTSLDLDRIGAYINAAFVFGWAIGGFIWGMFGDWAGRKKAVVFSVAFYGLFTVLTGYMNDWSGVVICRLLSGFGMGGVLVATTTIMIEEWPNKSKAIFMGFLSIAIPIGIFSAGIVTHRIHHWRAGFAIGFVPLVVSILSVWLLEESEAWKKSRVRTPAEFKNGKSIFSASSRRDLLMGSAIFGSMLIGLWAIFSWIPTWIQSLIAVGDGTSERSLSMMLFGIGGLTGGFFSGWLLKGTGSKKSLLICFAACSLSSILLFKTNDHFSPVIYLELLVLALFFGASQGVLSVFIPELFATNIRATATGFCFNIGRLLTATAVLFVGLLQSWMGGYGQALFIFSLVFPLGLLVTLLSNQGPGSPGKSG